MVRDKYLLVRKDMFLFCLMFITEVENSTEMILEAKT